VATARSGGNAKPGGTSTELRERGFVETIGKDFPKVRIVARQYGMADPARSRAAAENILTAHPDLGGIFASSEASSLGSIQALRSRNLSRTVKLVTFDFSDTHVEALKDGTIDLMLVQDPFRIGYEAVKSLVEKLGGHRTMELPVREIVKPTTSLRYACSPEWLQELTVPSLKSSPQRDDSQKMGHGWDAALASRYCGGRADAANLVGRCFLFSARSRFDARHSATAVDCGPAHRTPDPLCLSRARMRGRIVGWELRQRL
jgi:hypothetical protein